ncbi:MAG: hypothetical protein S4CHLAM7_02460 [Chlamydiae bacterium]|nr:hypothetical protein [Chlamydiota bacterium]
MFKKKMKIAFAVGFVMLALFAFGKFIFTYPDDYFQIGMRHFKSDSGFKYQVKKGYTSISRNDASFESIEPLLSNPESAFVNSEDWVKDQYIRSIVVCEIQGKKYLVKRHLNYKLDQYFLHNPSKALRSFYYGCKLDSMGIKNPRSIAVIEKRRGLLRLASYHVMEFIPGLIGDDFFKTQDPQSPELRESIAKSVEIVRKLDEAKIIHGDLRVKHFFYLGNEPYVIDLDTVHHYRFRTSFFVKKQNFKDLKRFVLGMKANLKNEDYEYFEKLYSSCMRKKPEEELLVKYKKK